MNRISIVIILFLIFSCGSGRRNNVIYLYSKDKSQVVSILSNYKKMKE
jgi:hypothetical protein